MVEGKYLDIKAGASRPKDLLQPVEGAPASPLLTDLGQPISAGGINQFLLFKALHLLITGIQQKPAPEAYLGYALYCLSRERSDSGTPTAICMTKAGSCCQKKPATATKN